MDRARLKRILAAIGIAVALAVAGWGLWTVTHPAEPATKTPASATAKAKAKAERKKAAKRTATASKSDMDAAVAAEHAMRDWGVDPTTDPASFKLKNASDVLQTLRTPDMPARPGALDPIAVTDDDGPNAPSTWCRSGSKGLCSDMGTSIAWLKNELWGVGSRWTDGPTASAEPDGRVRVTGTVRAVLVTQGDTLTGDGWSLLTPAWRDYDIDDLLTVENGKVVKVTHEGDDGWWYDPWLDDWTDGNPVDDMDDGTRVAIPVSGRLAFNGVSPTGLTGSLTCPGTFADMDGKIDWSLTKDLPVTAGDTDMDGQQPDDIDPEKDAATIHERE